MTSVLHLKVAHWMRSVSGGFSQGTFERTFVLAKLSVRSGKGRLFVRVLMLEFWGTSTIPILRGPPIPAFRIELIRKNRLR